MDTSKVDEILYRDKYIKRCYDDYYFVWNNICNNKDILNEAIIVKRDKFDENYTFSHLAIVVAMLMNFNQID